MSESSAPNPTDPSEARERALFLLESNHQFPCAFMVKVIGRAEGDFVERVIQVVRASHQEPTDPPFRVRETANGRHVAVTVEPHLESAHAVLLLYEQIRLVEGVVMLL